jgi:hypothetical protein
MSCYPKGVLCLLLFVANGFGQNCAKYGKTTTLTGTLVLRDEAGYRQYNILKLDRPICVVGETKDTAYPGDRDQHLETDVREMQAGAYLKEPAEGVLRDRLDRLTNQRVVIKGDLSVAMTGYQRTPVQLSVQTVDPVDVAGQEALLAKRPAFTVKRVEAYDVTVRTGKRLMIDVHESGSGAPLLPSDQYAPHWMTGGDVLYVNCREGYQHSLVSTSQKEHVICDDEDDLCGIGIWPKEAVTLKLRCTKKQ